MAQLVNIINTDEITYAQEFYKAIYGDDWNNYISMERYTDGFQNGILFEHKSNIKSYGEARALGQALIYLSRFNRDGMPVPRYVWLVSQEEERIYIYDALNYKKYINDIENYANLKPSSEDNTFLNGKIGKSKEIIEYKLTSIGLKPVLDKLQEIPEYIPVTITEHNVYGWANYYYENAKNNKQKPEKKEFFNELRKPTKTLKNYIEAWTGQETDFKYIMDILNDPMTQKKLGAFYTPPAYAKKAVELVKEAIKRVPKGNDYVIIDRCAGTGNLEMYLDDGEEDILSHVIVSTYELKEWMVLKDRFGKRVRYIIPPIPSDPKKLPKLNKDGFLSGANALSKDIITNLEIRKYIDDPKCTIILFENPPYSETTSIEFQKQGKGKESSGWKENFIVQEMKKEVKGVTSNDMANVFIWSGFKYFLRQPTDSYIVFSPIKYWKSQHLIDKKFINGFAFNRIHFHAKTNACISCILWSNETDKMTSSFNLKAFDLDDESNLIDEGDISVKKINSLFSEKYYDNRIDNNDTFNGICCDLNGTESTKSDNQISVGKNHNNNIIGYLVAQAAGFDNNRLLSSFTIAGRYNGHGFYLRNDNFIEKLPIFVASRYTDNYDNWKIMSMVMKSGDKSTQYKEDVENGTLDKFLCQCLIWSGFTHYAHMRSLESLNGEFYKNELCFDNTSSINPTIDDATIDKEKLIKQIECNKKKTLARIKLDEFIENGYKLSTQENELFEKWDSILNFIRENCKDEYNPKYTYGLYQIDEEINIKIKRIDGKGKVHNEPKYGDLNNLIKDMKKLIKQYYLDNLVDKLFEYEFLK